jgi:hypothetical protein
MLQVRNDTPFKAALMLLPDAAGVDTLFTIVKGTFTLALPVTVAEEQVPISMADRFYDDSPTRSIEIPSDVGLGKPATDVLVRGTAYAPDARPAWQMDVFVRVGPVSKHLRVYGDRVWQTGGPAATIGWVAPFERMPLVWERAFGGIDETNGGMVAERRNPVGAGFRASGSIRPHAGSPLPNVEDPRALITGPGDTPVPAGLGPIGAHWEPRAGYAGTYDDAWQNERAPYLPADFDPRFFQVAPPDQIAAGHLRGGEPIELDGLTPNGAVRSMVPALHVEATYSVDGRPVGQPAQLETVLLEPDLLRMVLVWRAALRCDKKALKVREVHTRAHAFV